MGYTSYPSDFERELIKTQAYRSKGTGISTQRQIGLEMVIMAVGAVMVEVNEWIVCRTHHRTNEPNGKIFALRSQSVWVLAI